MSVNNYEVKNVGKLNDCSAPHHRKKLKVENGNKDATEECATSEQKLFLSKLTFYILSTGIGKQRLQILQNQIRRYGGQLANRVMDSMYLIVDDSLDDTKLKRLLQPNEIPPHLKAVKSVWLSKCFQDQRLLPTFGFQFSLADNLNDSSSTKTIILAENKTKPDCTNSNFSADEDDAKQDSGFSSESTPQTSPEKDSPRMSKWVCSYPANEKPVNYNQHITEKLEVLADTYKNTKDHWRALGYQKALIALRNHPKEIRTREEALSLPGIGQSLANKIWEIVESGHLRKIDEICSGSKIEAINLFTKVWGAGPTTAEQWVQQGFRTLEDLRTKAKLTHQQEIGLKYFDELLDRMPRDEAGRIAETVKQAALSINSGLQVEACGSYRRGKQTCGDVDVLVTHPDGKSHEGLLDKIVDKLHQIGFLTDDLVKHGEYGDQKKYLGVCKLNEDNSKHRRLDIITVPYNELACALLYFTGSAHFNRSMRLLARKKGMALSEHSLNAGVVRKGQEKVFGGYILPTPTEESVFIHLGLQYRTPEERDH